MRSGSSKENESARQQRPELGQASFRRSIALRAPVVADKIEAHRQHGMLP
jgi:HSP20 family molecular chaperone IbpA